MHRFTFVHDTESATWVVPDGLHALPDGAARHLQARAILAVAEHAALFDSHGLRELSPTSPDVAWQKQPRRPLVPLMPEEPTVPCSLGTNDCELNLVDSRGRTWPITGELMLVGRHPVCTVTIPDSNVSALHCVMHRIPAGIRILDLDSTNGTFVNGARIHEAYVTRPTSIRLGDTLFELATGAASTEIVELASSAMRELDRIVARVAPTTAPVLISGESGVGKESIAQRLHASSGRRGRFVALNAAVITPSLAASELFGHVRGAFTGAERDRTGAFAFAAAGTLFLDEVAELPLEVQAELLRVLEQRAMRPVGGTHDVQVDVRLITATHADLAARVRAGVFREDLFHRICVIPLHMAPLRERPEDVETLARAFVSRQLGRRSLSAAAIEKLKGHLWPGNVRQLLNVLRRACVLTDHNVLEPADLDLGPSLSSSDQLGELMRSMVLQAYQSTGGSVADTARILGINRAAIYHHLRERMGRPRRNQQERPLTSSAA